MVSQQPLCNLERETTSCKMREWVDRIWPIRINEPGGLCWLRRYRVVIDDANENSCLKSLSNSFAIGGAAVHCEDELHAIFDCGGNCPFGNAMTVTVALRNVSLGDRPDGTQGTNHDRCSGQPIRVKIADHQDGLPRFTRSSQTRYQSTGVREQVWVVQGAVVAVKKSSRVSWLRESAAM